MIISGLTREKRDYLSRWIKEYKEIKINLPKDTSQQDTDINLPSEFTNLLVNRPQILEQKLGTLRNKENKFQLPEEIRHLHPELPAKSPDELLAEHPGHKAGLPGNHTTKRPRPRKKPKS